MSVCTFWVGGLLCGLDVQEVQEIGTPQTLTPVPLAPPAVAGLVNLRGQILTAVDLRGRLGVVAEGDPMSIVLRSEPVCLLVDRAGDIVDLPEDAWEVPPSTLDGTLKDVVVGVARQPECLLLKLDAGKVLTLG
ncbi:MAG: chemotaxis protein CheW [Candidatus Xenobia bacterium]